MHQRRRMKHHDIFKLSFFLEPLISTHITIWTLNRGSNHPSRSPISSVRPNADGCWILCSEVQRSVGSTISLRWLLWDAWVGPFCWMQISFLNSFDMKSLWHQLVYDQLYSYSTYHINLCYYISSYCTTDTLNNTCFQSRVQTLPAFRQSQVQNLRRKKSMWLPSNRGRDTFQH